MQKKLEHLAQETGERELSRRQILKGAAVVALAASAPAILATPPRQQVRRRMELAPTSPARVYMAAATLLHDGRVLVTGGYDRPATDELGARPLSSALIFNPQDGSWVAAASMSTPRARHAAVTLQDGRVAVLGGMSVNATSSVEVYDPQSNRWTYAKSLSQPRYDHAAVANGSSIYVVGGSSESAMAGVELIQALEPTID